jgi:hypothetical protein
MYFQPIHWRVPVNKALRTLPWYLLVPLSAFFLLDILDMMSGAHHYHGSDYDKVLGIGFGLWLIRQFFRFWGYIFRRFRTYGTTW